MQSIFTQTIFCALSALALATATTGCNGGAPSAAMTPGQTLGTDSTAGSPANIPSGAADTGAGNAPTQAATNVVGPTCVSSDSNNLCVALKYVPYVDPSTGLPVVSQAQAIADVKAINAAWAQCSISFQIEEFTPTDAAAKGLSFETANSSELDPIRGAFENDHTLLVVTTGTWNRSGSLGSTGANAWTNLPGSGTYGAILEQPVGTFPLIIAHELGHYLNLDHVSDQSDLMNPIIYDSSNTLYASQCATARSAVNYFWQKMKR